LTSTTGASPQAEAFACFSVNIRSSVVSPNPMPSFRFRCSAASLALCRAHGRLVQIVSLNLPIGSVLYIS
jgi:hypothetical protein